MQTVEILAPNDQFIPGVAPSVNAKPLTIQDSLPIKAAEYWLKMGKADQALRELWKVCRRRSGHLVGPSEPGLLPWGVLRGRDELN
jgi:hypothetical protein